MVIILTCLGLSYRSIIWLVHQWCPKLLSPLKCAKHHHLDELYWYMEAMPVGDGFHPTKKTFYGRALRDQGTTRKNPQTLHSQISRNYSSPFHNHLLFPQLPTNWWGRHKNTLLPSLYLAWTACSILRIFIFSVGLTTNIRIIQHNGIGILDLFIGDILCLSKILMVLNFV